VKHVARSATGLRPLVGIFVATLAVMSCRASSQAAPDAQPNAQTPMPRAKTIIETANGRAYQVAVEVARTPADRTRGLMFRTQLGRDDGMLFIFDEDEDNGFWMRNTFIPLDMIFIDSSGKIVGIVANAEPKSEVSRHVGIPNRYVLEVNGGWSAEHGVAAGDRVRFDGL
jgi:uncharacterized protein